MLGSFRQYNARAAATLLVDDPENFPGLRTLATHYSVTLWSPSRANLSNMHFPGNVFRSPYDTHPYDTHPDDTHPYDTHPYDTHPYDTHPYDTHPPPRPPSPKV